MGKRGKALKKLQLIQQNFLGGPPIGGPFPNQFPGGQPNPEVDHFGNLMNPPRPHPGPMHLRGPPMHYGHDGMLGPGPSMQPYGQPMPPHEYGGQGLQPGPIMEHFNPNSHGYQGQPTTRDEPTKILRRPFDSTSVPPVQTKSQNNDVYDPSFPTSVNIHPNEMRQDNFNHQSQNFQPLQIQVAPPHIFENPPEPTHPVQAPAQDHRFGNFSNMPVGAQQNVSNAPAPSAVQTEPKVRVMTGLVTQIQAGGFGMISEEIFFQQSAVTGDMPKVGDKVVVEAEAVNGMPFKYNAKKVTKLDADLVRDNSSSLGPTSSYNPPSNSNLGAGSSFPDSHSLHRRPATPPLKSILKRNPPPPPIISKTGEKSLRNDLNLQSTTTTKSTYKAAIEDEFHRSTMEAHRRQSMELEIQPLRLAPPASVADFPEFTYVTDNILNLNNRKPSPQVRDRLTRTPPEIIDFMEILNRSRQRSPTSQSYNDDRRANSTKKSSTQKRRKSASKSPDRHRRSRKRSSSKSPSPKRRHPSPSRKNRSRSSTPKRQRKQSLSPKHRNRPRSRSSSSHGHHRKSSHVDSRGRKRSRSNSLSQRHKRSRSSSRNRKRSRSSSRGRNNSPAVQRHRRKSRSNSRDRKRSRSSSLSRRNQYKPSPLPSPSRLYRIRSGSATPPENSRRNRSTSRDGRNRSITPTRHGNRSKSKERYSSPSGSRSRTRHRSVDRRRRSRSSSSSPRSDPPSSSQQHSNIVHAQMSSTSFPRLVDQNYKGESSKQRKENSSKRNEDSESSMSSTRRPPLPIKFQIANPVASKPAPVSSLPNPSFIPTSQLKNSAFNITKTVVNTSATLPEKKKKPKEQEPAFRVKQDSKGKGPAEQPAKPEANEPRFLLIEEKIRQWEQERKTTTQTPAPVKPSKPTTLDTVTVSKPKPALDILQLKQTVQKDLHELRAKEGHGADVGKKSIVNSINIEEIKQTVQRDLSTLKDKPVAPPKVAENLKSAPPPQEVKKSIDIAALKNTVQEGLKELRSKFNQQSAGASSHANKSDRNAGSEKRDQFQPNKSREDNSNAKPEPTKTIFCTIKNQRKRSPEPPREIRADRTRSYERYQNDVVPFMEPVNEEMERVKDEIHRQRLLEEEHRLRAMGDEAGLQQLYYMEDRRRRRIDERQLTRLRQREIQLKKEKNFAELTALRREWGPPHERYEQEKALRQRRLAEEHEEANLIGQAEAIRRHEAEYQEWLEEEATARLRDHRDAERASRGSEGLVLRRRTPSPSSSSGSRRIGSHRRRSRSPSYERYRDDWRQRAPRNRSPEMDYEAFIMRYRKGPPPTDEFGPGFGFPPDFEDHAFPQQEHDAFLIARAMDDASRREEELRQRELEIRHRLGDLNEMRFQGLHPNDPRVRNRDPRDRGEYGRFAVPRH